VYDVVGVIDSLTADAGLNRECTVLLAAAWAEARDRGWYHYGAPLAPPAFKDIQGHHQLREPVLPDRAEWDRAVLAAQHLFGLPARGHLSPTNLGRLASDVSDFAAPHVRGAEDLVQPLVQLTHRLRAPDTGARLAL